MSKFFLGAELPNARGLNISHDWFERVRDWARRSNPTQSDRVIDELADSYLRKVIDDSVKNLPDSTKQDIFRAVKKGEAVVFISRDVGGRGVGVHEVMHSLTGKELGKDLSGPDVSIDEMVQFVKDSKSSDVRDVSFASPEWLGRRQEFFTEVMTQYFLGNLKQGSKTLRLAEAILRTSDDPVVRQLLGASLGAVISFGLAKKLQGKKTD